MPEAFLGLGAALQLKGQPHEAIDVIRKLLAIHPDHPAALNNLANPLGTLDHLDDAAAAYRRALQLRPKFAAAQVGLGSILWRRGQVDDAITEYEKALQTDPNSAEGLSNLGTALLEKGEIDRAEQCYRKSIQSNPNYALAHTNLGLLLLLRGDFENGWREHEWRSNAIEVGKLAQKFREPQWDGADLNGRPILIYAEQGFGDAIQFVRYIPQVIARGGKVILRCPGELPRLFQQIQGVDRLILNDDPLPSFDVQSSLLSLPMVIGTRLENIPGNVPYLLAEPSLSEHWAQRLRNEARLKVGLAWAGKKGHIHDRRRSMSLAALESLAELKNSVSFFSLQKGEAASQAKDSPLEMIDWTSELHDFADTAALIDRLDLVITVDTAIAHLAGAMGKRVWVLLQQMPDWRWMLDRADSPWYPTMKLFRQSNPGDWSMPVGQVLQSLRGMS
jgi:Tfp pilus assembly protein PilF